MLKQRALRLLFIATAFLFLFPFIAFTSVKIMDNSGEKRPDILTIDIPSSPDHKDMPPVQFMHDKHTQALDGKCAACHDEKQGQPVFKFKRLEDVKGQDYMDLYHDNCVACHTEMKSADATGPMEGECRVCHNADFKVKSSRTKIEFDRSLHYRHENAKTIPSTLKGEEANCSACHHSANMKTKETFYQKGEESACVYCHNDKPAAEGIRDTRDASHTSCVTCHLKLSKEKTATGPIDCQGCHALENQKKFKTIKDIPRLDRNQPDTVMMTGWTTLPANPDESKKTVAQHMDGVPFDHKFHETKVDSCKSCHHESLDKCVSCHTVTGEEKGGFVRLDQAMHSKDASQSCIACHNEQKAAKDCAGCHFQMPEKAFQDNDCASCHRTDLKAQPLDLLKDKNAKADMAMDAINADNYGRVDMDKVPETVEIKVIADEYKPSQFPHRMVVKAVFEAAEKNSMANTFHKDQLTLCMGCHHNSPATMTPPNCASCHGSTPDVATGKPGLKGAYHGQCITCHQKMEVKSVLPTDCTKCHDKKE